MGTFGGKFAPETHFPGDMSFEYEIVHYLRSGLLGRCGHCQKQGKKVPQVDFKMYFSSNEDKDFFGQHICGYYQRISLNKKALYEEFGKLLGDFDFISIQFRFASPSNKIQAYFGDYETCKFFKFQANKLPYKPNEITVLNQLLTQSELSLDHYNLYNQVDPFRTVKMSAYCPFFRLSQEVYDDIDLKYLIRNNLEKKNLVFFTQKKVQKLVAHLSSNAYFFSLDLMDIPDIFRMITQRELQIQESYSNRRHDDNQREHMFDH